MPKLSEFRFPTRQRGVLVGVAVLLLVSATWATTRATQARPDNTISRNATRMLEEGKQTFRFDTFGDEAFWGDALQLHRAIAGERNGGVERA